MPGGGSGVPVPFNVTMMLGWAGSSVARVRLAVAAPVDDGAKVTPSVRLLDAGTVSELGLTENGALVVAEETCNGTGPEFVTVTVPWLVRQTGTDPRSRGFGATLALGRPPAPDIAMLTLACAASLVVNVRFPE